MMFLIFLAILPLSTLCAETSIENYLTDVEVQYPVSGMSLVDCVYVINLQCRPQKWLATNSAFHSYGIYPNRVEAINGWMLSTKDKKILSGEFPLRLRGGQMGCILSHLSTLRDAFKRGYKVIWVCEDDIQICDNPHPLSVLIAALSRIDPEWDVLYTDRDSKNKWGKVAPSLASDFRPGFPHKDLSYYTKREFINADLVKINQRFGAYSMIVSKRGIEKILSYFCDNYFWTAYDIDIHYIHGIRQYCTKKDWVSIDWEKASDT